MSLVVQAELLVDAAKLNDGETVNAFGLMVPLMVATPLVPDV